MHYETIIKTGSTICSISFVLKVVIHQYLDYHNGYEVLWRGLNAGSAKIFLPYQNTVKANLFALKRICNVLYILFLLSLIGTLGLNLSLK